MAEKLVSTFSGQVVDVVGGRIFPGEVTVTDGRITSVKEKPTAENRYLMPGLVDAHIHIESSMLTPAEFARVALPHGTIACVCDPHEIANVCGEAGIEFMQRSGEQVPLRFFFGVPSCVPATDMESSGARLDSGAIERLLAKKEHLFLAEMMNFPGVLGKDKEVLAKLEAARRHRKPIDGHAPGVTGEALRRYVESGISTDHESTNIEEAREKIDLGMKVLIREGSAAKNFEALAPLIDEAGSMVMFCSDDRHPDDLIRGHINTLVMRALQAGYETMKVLRAATYNPVNHYHLPMGLLQVGDSADFMVVDSLSKFKVEAVYVDGVMVAQNGKALFEAKQEVGPNNFYAHIVSPQEVCLPAPTPCSKIRVIEVLDGQLLTKEVVESASVVSGNLVGDLSKDILKLVVLNRYQDAKPAIGFVKGFGLRRGALGSTVAHDSHNMIAIGCDDESLSRCINLLARAEGGICAIDGAEEEILPLPVGGIMSDKSGVEVAERYRLLNEQAHAMGSGLTAPYMTMSFLALIVIPSLKLSDRGLFSVDTFQYVSVGV